MSSRRYPDIGRYRILEPLGEGGMGAVFRAVDPRFDREVAIKVIRAETLSDKARARFGREAAALGTLSHPAIIRVHDMGNDGGQLFLVLELVPGARSLEDAAQGLARRAVLRLLLEIARALGHAHGRGVVHRDVKPANILVDGQRRPYLTDFGLVTGERFDDQTQLTQSGTLVGTPAYMAPEQVDGRNGAVGPHTDVWAFGVVLYEVLCGVAPFQVDSLPELLFSIRQARYAPPRQVDPTISPALAAVVKRALQAEPDRRFPDGDALAQALAAALTESPASRRSDRRPLLFAGAVAVSLVGLAVAFTLRARAPSGLGVPTSTGPTADPLASEVSTSPGPTSDPVASSPSAPGREASPASAALALAEASVGTADRLLEAGDMEGAIAELTRALELVPRDPGLWVQRSLYSALAGQSEQALADAEQALVLAPGSAAGLRALGVAHLRAGDFEEALDASQRAVDARSDSAEAWTLHAEALRLNGRLEEARRANEQALKVEPENTEALHNLAILLMEAGDPDRAETLLRRVVALDPTEATPWSNLARISARKKEFTAARAVLTRGLQIAGHAMLFEARARLRAREKDYGGALEDFDEALKLDPEHVDAWIGRATVLKTLERNAEALRDVSRALDAKPDTVRQLQQLYMLAWSLGDNALWTRAVEGSLALREDDPSAWNALGVVRERSGDLKGALIAYDRAIAQSADEAAILFNRGELHHRLGNLKLAQQDLARSLELLDPASDTKAIAAAKTMLAEIEAKLDR